MKLCYYNSLKRKGMGEQWKRGEKSSRELDAGAEGVKAR